jgi:uncharacterized protein YfaA (DUF2138 family)
MKISKKIIKWGGAALGGATLVALAAFAVGQIQLGREWVNGESLPPLTIDLNKPDALILTESLAQLPRDVLSVPLFKDLLTEEFVFYYEQNEGRLGLQGTLRRIAYEHELSISDGLIADVMDKPAELALWKSPDGRLGHYLIVLRRDGLTKLLETVTTAAIEDSQLHRVGNAYLSNGDAAAVYQLDYAYNRRLYFAGYGDRLVVFSDPRMVLSADKAEASSKNLDILFKPGKGSHIYSERFRVAKKPTKHSVMVSAEYLSFGYQTFFPSLQALRFDYAPQGWSTAVLSDIGKQQSLFDAASLWKVVPTSPSLCVAVPVEMQRIQPLLQKVKAMDEANKNPVNFESPVAACWYPESSLHAPLIVVKTQDSKAARDYLETIFHQAPLLRWRQAVRHAEIDGKRFDVKKSKLKSATVWRRMVSSDYGLRDAENIPEKERLSSRRYFNVTMAYSGGYLFFSPNDKLVDNGLAVVNKQYPALSDSLRGTQTASVVIYPATFSMLMEAAVLEAVPGDREPVFRETASKRLLPVLRSVAKYPPYALSMPHESTSGLAWESLKWETLPQ